MCFVKGGGRLGGELHVRPRPVRRRARQRAERAGRRLRSGRQAKHPRHQGGPVTLPQRVPARHQQRRRFPQAFMPNLYQLWQNGVKFAGHYTAACACTPARGTIITGLYSQQSWLVQTITAPPGQPVSPAALAEPGLPDLRQAAAPGRLPDALHGKWHVSIPRQDTPRLEEYGFDGLTWPDPTGANLQGTVGDETYVYTVPISTASRARALSQRRGHRNPGGAVAAAVRGRRGGALVPDGLLRQPARQGVLLGRHRVPKLQSAVQFAVENTSRSPTTRKHQNPSQQPAAGALGSGPAQEPAVARLPGRPAQLGDRATTQGEQAIDADFVRLFSEAVWGGVADDPAQQGFTIDPYPPAPSPRLQERKPLGIGKAPFGYWRRSLNSYAQIMNVVDGPIGTVLKAFIDLPASVQQNTVIVFMSDHGEYASAHGFLSGSSGASTRRPTTCRSSSWIRRALYGRHRHAPPGPHLLRRRAPAAHQPRPRR